ncbi:MAG: methyltransferase family protein [Bacteroidota bacterium]
MSKVYSNVLVTIQFAAIGVMAASGPLLAGTWYLLLAEIAGITLGLYAIYIMRPGNFNIRPVVKETGVLITHGPYKFIRHPMYTSILLALTPLLIDHFTLFRFIVMLILTINLVIKLRYEEGLLTAHFSDYPDYMKATNRMIPCVF